tara:strand:- start:1410 stop:1802 length:393 start_codon:yes stop_codon:yes gene_type:complete
MKMIWFVVFFFLAIGIYFSLNQSKKMKFEKDHISGSEGLDIYNSKTHLFLDVRTEEENLDNAIPNSLLIPLQELNDRLEELNDFKDKNIIVYCASGSRSANATTFLRRIGFQAQNLEGGMFSWNGPTTKY